MVKTGMKMCGIHEPVGAAIFAQGVGETGPEGHLNPLDGIHDQKAQFPVEDVNIQNIAEGDAVVEGMRCSGRTIFLEGQEIPGEAEISDELEIVTGLVTIRDRQAPRDQQVDLLVEAERRFAVGQ